MKNSIFTRLLTIILILGLMSAYLTPQMVSAVTSSPQTIVETEQIAPPPPGVIQSLSGSRVTFDPTAGGAGGYVAGVPTTLYFRSDIYTTDWEWLNNTWLRFPSDWTITNVTVAGTPSCESVTGAWGNFELLWETSPFEIKIQHSAIMETTDHCVANYAVDVTPGDSAETVSVSWYFEGDTGLDAATPHYPCSSDEYTPTSMYILNLICDESVNPPASVPEVFLVAQAQTVTTPEDTAIGITLEAIGGALTFSVVAAPSHGSLSGTAPDLIYTPALNYNGLDSFTFKVNDGTVDSNIATVSITVTPVNDAPVAFSQSVTMVEDIAKAITLIATDVDGDNLTYLIETAPLHGALSGTIPELTYTPAADYNGPDSFSFKANDGTVDSNIATVTITVNPAIEVPIAQSQSVTTPEETAIAITLIASDADSVFLTYSVVGSPSHGSLSGTVPNLTYTPAVNYNGQDSFTFKANDGFSDSNIAMVSITVTPVNDVPIAQGQVVTTNEDVPVAINLVVADVDVDPLTYTIVVAPLHGTLSGTAPNLTYTPAANYNGPDSFTFKANDGTVDSNIATVSITVTAVNDAPVAQSQTVTTDENVAVAITLVATDVESALLSYSVVVAPLHGTLTGIAPNLTYTPDTGYFGADSFTFKANDGTVDSNIATVSITINQAIKYYLPVFFN